ncbi:MAG: D-alanine--D-alanine ligase family protein [Candidatus Aminicenantaceae bacterium]
MNENSKQKKLKVALLFGGRSAEHEISLLSASAIYKNLDKSKYDCILIYINKKGLWKIINSLPFPSSQLEKGIFHSFLPFQKKQSPLNTSPDIFFPVLHGPYGEDGTIQGLLEMSDVPYVGASVLPSAIGMDKSATKNALIMNGLPVTEHLVIYDNHWHKEQKSILSTIVGQIPLPLFIKPANMGSSVGITKVTETNKITDAVSTAFQYDRKIIVEKAIKGRELECSVLGNDDPFASLPGEIIPYREFYDYKDKYIEGKTRFKIPAELPDTIINEIQQLSIKAYKAIDCCGMARVDFFLENKKKNIFINEINTIPGFTEISMFPKLLELSGISFPVVLEKLIDLAVERHRKKRKIKAN